MGNIVPDALTHTHTVVTVGATTTTALAASARRRYALLINDSDETIYLSLDGTAAALNDGIRLNANGGSYEMSERTGSIAQSIIYAICASGSKKLLVTEGS
jgi:hypothetical protein